MTRPRGIPKAKWEDQVLEDIKSTVAITQRKNITIKIEDDNISCQNTNLTIGDHNGKLNSYFSIIFDL